MHATRLTHVARETRDIGTGAAEKVVEEGGLTLRPATNRLYLMRPAFGEIRTTPERSPPVTTSTRFPLAELVRLPSFYFPVPSWDGTKVAYFSDESGRMELWLMDAETGDARQVSQG